jgi:zinc protease
VSRSVRTVAWLLPALALLALTASAQTRWPSEGPPRPLPAHDVNFPPYDTRTLDNGLQVVAVLHHEQPIVSMRMLVRAGGALDPPQKLGLANLAASLLDQGTATQSASEVNDAIDFMGGAMGAGAGADLTFVNVVVMKDSFEAGLRILSDMARHPGFAQAEIDRQRQQAMSSLQVNFEDPDFVANAVFDRLVYGFHPYGLPQDGTPDTLSAITRDDIVAYHQRYFVPNNAIVAIVGDVTAEEAFAGVSKIFGDWPRREVPKATLTAPPDPTRRVVVINKPDAVQTEVRVGHLGIKRGNNDYMAVNLALRILGGEGANRLHQVLRTERSLTYGAKADMDALLETGDFEASTNTRSEATGEVLRLIVDEFWRLQRERVGDRELNDAKAYLTGSFPLTIETPDAIATQVLNVLFYGLPVEQLQSFRQRVNAIRPDDIERVARYFLHPDRLSIVLVGNAAAFLPQLRSQGFNNVDVVNMTDLDLLAVDFRKSGAPRSAGRGARLDRVVRAPAAYVAAAAQSTRTIEPPKDNTAAEQLLNRMIAAKGGLQRLRGVRTITVKTEAVNKGPSGDARLQTLTQLEYPNHVHVEMKGDRGEMVQVFDGVNAWVKDPNGVHEVPEDVVADLQAGLKRDTLSVLLAAADGKIKFRMLSDSRDESGKTLHAMEFTGPDLDPVVFYADATSHLVVKQTYVAGGPGSPVIEELFGDYRAVDGVQISFSATVRSRGEVVLERKVTEFAINRPLAASLFTRPAP